MMVLTMNKDHISLAYGGGHSVGGDTQISAHVGSLDVV